MKKSINVFIFFLFVTVQLFAQDSVYIHLKSKPMVKIAIGDIDSIKFEKPIQYSYFISKVSTQRFIHYSTTIPSLNVSADFEMAFNSNNVNLNSIVMATAITGLIEKKFADYGLGAAGVNYKFVFSSSFSYLGVDGVTNMNSFLQTQSDGTISVVGGASAVDRTPVVMVQLQKMTGEVLAQAYIKIKITLPLDYNMPISKTFTYPTIQYASLFKGISTLQQNVTDFNITDSQMLEIYSNIGITHNEFQSVYLGLTPTLSVTINSVSVTSPTLTQYPLMMSLTAPNEPPVKFRIQITPLAKFGTTTIKYTFTPTVVGYPILNLTFNYTITKPVLDKTILSAYQYQNTTTVATSGMKAGMVWNMELYLGEAFGYGSTSYRNMFGIATNGKIDGAAHSFNFKTTIPVQTDAQLIPSTGGTIDQALGSSSSAYSGQLLSLISKLSVAQKTYNMEFVTTYPNSERDVLNFDVIFVNPLSIEQHSTASFTLTDYITGSPSSLDLKNNYIVKFMGKNMVTKGVAETTNTSTTIVASDIVDISNANYGLFYQLTPYTAYSSSISKSGGNAFSKIGLITWSNKGSLLYLAYNVGTVNVKFVTSFAEITKSSDNIIVIPQ